MGKFEDLMDVQKDTNDRVKKLEKAEQERAERRKKKEDENPGKKAEEDDDWFED